MKKQLEVVLTGLLAACGGTSSQSTSKVPPANSDEVELTWQASQADGDNVHVSLVVEGETVSVGTLSAANDGTPSSCQIGDMTPTKIAFECGDTPKYNFYEAELQYGELIITLVTGVDGDDSSVKRTIVARVLVHGKTLKISPSSVWLRDS